MQGTWTMRGPIFKIKDLPMPKKSTNLINDLVTKLTQIPEKEQIKILNQTLSVMDAHLPDEGEQGEPVQLTPMQPQIGTQITPSNYLKMLRKYPEYFRAVADAEDATAIGLVDRIFEPVTRRMLANDGLKPFLVTGIAPGFRPDATALQKVMHVAKSVVFSVTGVCLP